MGIGYRSVAFSRIRFFSSFVCEFLTQVIWYKGTFLLVHVGTKACFWYTSLVNKLVVCVITRTDLHSRSCLLILIMGLQYFWRNILFLPLAGYLTFRSFSLLFTRPRRRFSIFNLPEKTGRKIMLLACHKKVCVDLCFPSKKRKLVFHLEFNT